MISGTFHQLSQDWRYFSREKSLLHTLHLGQLPSGTRGETIEIAATAPTAHNDGNNGFSVPGTVMPVAGGIIENVTFNVTTLSTCYGSVGINRQILAQKNVIVQISRWDKAEMRFLMTPQEAGLFLIYCEAQSDERDPSAGYFGPVNPTSGVQAQFIVCNVTKIGHVSFMSATSAIYQNGPMDGSVTPLHWGPNLYIKTTHVCRTHGFAYLSKGQALEFKGLLLGNPPDAYVSGYILKVADIPE